MSRIIVTGGAGFIGSHIVDELIKQHHRVWVVDDLSSGKEENISKAAELIKLDIADPALKSIFEKTRPEYIFHLAAQKSVKKSVENPTFDAEVNIIGSLNLLENCKSFNVKKIIFLSTGGAIYGDTGMIPTPETHLENPVSPYGVAKLAVDKYLHYYHHTFNLKYVSLRLANVYGPRQDPEGEAGVVAIFLDRILTNQQPLVFGTGKQTRDYIFVDDVVKASILAMDNKAKGIFNIGTAKETNVNELFDKIKQISKTKFNKKNGDPLPGEQMKSCLSYKKFNNATGWSPRVSLEEGLQMTNDWFKKEYEKNRI